MCNIIIIINIILSLLLFAGLNMIVRKMASSANPTVWLIKDENDQYTFSTQSTMKNVTLSFKLNEEFDEETMDGRKVKTLMTLDGNTLTQKQTGEKASTIIREFTETECICTMTLGDITCVRKYKVV